MVGKKKAAKSAKAKKKSAVAKKTPVKRKKRADKRGESLEDLQARFSHDESEHEEMRAKLNADVEANPYVYKVIGFLNATTYCVDCFKTLKGAQDCVDANSQLNLISWSIVVEKRVPDSMLAFALHNAW